MTISKLQIVQQLQKLPAERVKALVLSWLLESDGNLGEFESLLHEATEDPVWTMGEISEALVFEPLTEAEMIAKSQEALKAYQENGRAIPTDQVKQWANSLVNLNA